jgi:hypothetical protein
MARAELARNRLREASRPLIPKLSWVEQLLEGGQIPNFFAYFALFAWPAVCVILFVRLPVERAAIWSLLGGYLLLPSGTTVDLSLFPPLDKSSIPSVTTFLLCWMRGAHSPPPRRSMLIYILAFVFVISPIFTSLNNSYELAIADRSLPGFYPVDALKYSLHNLIVLAPFFVGLRFLSSDHGRELLLKALPTAAVLYSVPMLFEVRFSPQLHRWVYGYFPHDFSMTARDGGFRPVVFLNHGLEVALFAAMAVIAAIVAARGRQRIWQQPATFVAGYLAIILLLCKTLGAAVYAAVGAPLVLFTKPRSWLTVASAILLIVCAYPFLRSAQLIPVHQIASAASIISADRASSFRYRVENEDLLLAKANEKPLFGWGTWGRSRVFQADTGQDIATTDGTWIIQFGMFGWSGYLSLFVLFATALFRARASIGRQVTRETIVLGGLGLLLAVNMVDLLPNSSLLPVTYMLAGSIAGRVRARSAKPIARGRTSVSQVAAAAR